MTEKDREGASLVVHSIATRFTILTSLRVKFCLCLSHVRVESYIPKFM